MLDILKISKNPFCEVKAAFDAFFCGTLTSSMSMHFFQLSIFYSSTYDIECDCKQAFSIIRYGPPLTKKTVTLKTCVNRK